MTKALHTPGPWHRNIAPASKYPVIFAGRNTHVAQVCSAGLSQEEVEANCDLIAAGPILLDALQSIIRIAALREHNATNPQALCELHRDSAGTASAAIAKCRGPQP